MLRTPAKFGFGLIAAGLLTACGQPELEDKYLWLEEVDGEKALEWVHKTNKATDDRLASDPLYKELYADAMAALESKDRLPNITLKGDKVYNLWKDADHPRGLYRRTSIESFESGNPKWETVIDVDALSKAEGVQWVLKGLNCLSPEYKRCLARLSPGGGDAIELREFDAEKLEFVKDGFNLPKSKMRISWKDENTLYAGTFFGEGSMTESGYPRIIKEWKRGTEIETANTILEVDPKSVWAWGARFKTDAGDLDILAEGIDFWTNNYFQEVDGKAVKLPLPITAAINDAIDGKLIVSLKKDWEFNGTTYTQGSVLLVDPNALRLGSGEGTIQTLVKADPKFIVEEVAATPNGILVVALEDVKSSVYRFEKEGNGWVAKKVDLPTTGNIAIETINHNTGEFFARYEDFVTPPTLYRVDPKLNPNVSKQQGSTFDGSKFKSEQFFATSKDGTQVPYFVVMSKDAKLNGKNPTHMFSYGGFRASLTPSYSGSYEALNGAYGKMWLERGGVFVLANIRGGGEYGPAWHAAALLENRTKAYEDFEAIAEDLIAKKITSSNHLSIEGRSNGGLLVGATMTRRPDLYNAVICGVPLLDMKRYHTLLAGASWMAEYGNPDTSDWDFIKEYSPYQNVKANVEYPDIFFFTSTRDDRVHPGHARKMAARMMEQGHKVEYYENLEGGHGGSSTNDQLAKRIALGYTHLWKSIK